MARSIDINHILVETDSPYLTPEEMRGEKNTPLNLKFIIEKLAEELAMTEDEVIEITTENAKGLFNLFK
jgi:TatD DNase family protein